LSAVKDLGLEITQNQVLFAQEGLLDHPCGWCFSWSNKNNE
jgi:hypothetical protein